MVVLPASLSDELGRHIEEFSDAGDPQAYVFGGPDGGPTRASNFRNRHFHPALARAGLPEMRPHDLRHSAATLLFEAGASPKEVQEALGHADPRFTLRVYTAVLDAMRERTAERLDEKIMGTAVTDAKVIAFPS